MEHDPLRQVKSFLKDVERGAEIIPPGKNCAIELMGLLMQGFAGFGHRILSEDIENGHGVTVKFADGKYYRITVKEVEQ